MRYVLEMRSTQDWSDCRYRAYTSSQKMADLFEKVPKIKFTDSGHGLVTVVGKAAPPYRPTISILATYVRTEMRKLEGKTA